MTVIFTIKALTNKPLRIAHPHISLSEGAPSPIENNTSAHI